MCYHGQAAAIRVIGEADGHFDRADRILFYGVGSESRYTDTSVYWLNYGGTAGKRMQQVNATPDATTKLVSAHLANAVAEESSGYYSRYPTSKGDHWFYGGEVWLFANPANSYSRSIDVTETPTYSGTATLRVALQGKTADRHEIRFQFNGVVLGSRSWDGESYAVVSLSIPSSLIRRGANELTMANADPEGAPEFVLLDYFTLEFAGKNVASSGLLAFKGQAGTWTYRLTGFSGAGVQLYDITYPMEVRLLSGVTAEAMKETRLPQVAKNYRYGASVADSAAPMLSGAAANGYALAFQDSTDVAHTYWAGEESAILKPKAVVADTPSALKWVTDNIDYIMITHSDFMTETNRLAQRRRSDGLKVVVADVQDVYDEFSYGEVNPEAIRTFLGYTYNYWGQGTYHPTYVLLVGDGSYDYLDNFQRGAKEYIPPYMLTLEPDHGETSSDLWFVKFGGDGAPPSMYIGRLPVSSAAEVRLVIDKILTYPTFSAAGGWDKRLVLVADNTYDSSGVQIEIPDFAGSSDEIYQQFVKTPYTGTRLYYDPRTASAGLPGRYTDETLLRTALLSAFNSGSLFWNYMGHSSPEQWMAPEEVFHARDVASLTNTTRLPVLLSMTCFTGAFHEAVIRTLDEQLLVANGGVIASWSPTSLGQADAHDLMQQAFYTEVFIHGQKQLGRAVAAGIQSAYTNGWKNTADTFVLFGDPAMMIR
jgi:hypothetical protein